MRDEYVPGDYNIISDRSGFKIKHSQSRMEWTHSVVDKTEWEVRHPQDFLKAVPDRQSVSDPRPGAVDGFAETTTTLDAEELTGQTTLSVTSTSTMAVGDSILIFMDNDITHISTILSFVENDTVTINDSLTFKASSGNTVIIFSNETQESDL